MRVAPRVVGAEFVDRVVESAAEAPATARRRCVGVPWQTPIAGARMSMRCLPRGSVKPNRNHEKNAERGKMIELVLANPTSTSRPPK